ADVGVYSLAGAATLAREFDALRAGVTLAATFDRTLTEGRLMFQGQLLAIFIAPRESAPLEAVEQAEALTGRGLVGDRYARAAGTFSKGREPKPDQEVTLIESEALSAAAGDYGVELPPDRARRNLLTRGVPLNHLV